MAYKNPEDAKAYNKKRYAENREILLAKNREYKAANKAKINARRRLSYILKPWKKTKKNVTNRIRNENHKSHKTYKHVKDFMKLKDYEFLYKRDNAHLLKQPSIDRKDSKGHYTVENCRYIEMTDNAAAGRETQRKMREAVAQSK